MLLMDSLRWRYCGWLKPPPVRVDASSWSTCNSNKAQCKVLCQQGQTTLGQHCREHHQPAAALQATHTLNG
jgi:hypothetical protein